MIDHAPESRLLSGAALPASPPPSGSSELSFRQILSVLRRRYRLVLLMTAFGAAAGAFLASTEPPTYQAHAVLRIAGERRALTGGMEGPAPEVGRMTDPILSLVQLVRSRTVIGGVVDSLGLQLQSRTPEFATSILSRIAVDQRTGGDSVMLSFGSDRVTARYEGWEATAAYGQDLVLGTVRFAVSAHPAITEAVLGVVPREIAIDQVLQILSVTARTDTDLMDVIYISQDPVRAQQIVNKTVTAFQAFNTQAAKEKSRRRRIVLEEQLAQSDSVLTQAQSALAAFRSRRQLGSSEGRLASEQQSLLLLDERRTEMETDRNTYSRLLQQLRSGGAAERTAAMRALASSPALGDNPQVAGLYTKLNEYQYRLDSMTTGPYAASPSNPDVITLRNMIGSTHGELTEAVGAHLQSLDARIASLSDLRERSGQSIQVLPAVVEEELRLQSRVQTLTQVGEQLRQDFQRARLTEAVEAGDVEIIDLADVPYMPMPSTVYVKFALGLTLGLLLGGCLAFLFEALNTSIRRPEDIETALQVPGLAVIPRLASGSAPNRLRLGGLVKGGGKLAPSSRPAEIGTATDPFSVGIEAFRMLRTSLVWAEGAEHLQALVVTSAAPGEGKTLTSANLAVSFAHDGLRVLLVDCDVRRPKLHGLFRVPRSPGLLDLLAPSNGMDPAVGSLSFGEPSSEALEHALRPTPVRGLTLLTCGSLPTNPSNLLSGLRMQQLLKEFKRRFDVIILDTPPILATADAGILGRLVDGVLLVVRAGQTDRAAAQRAQHQLNNAGARVVGAVLNDPQGELSHFGDFYYPYEYAPESS